MIEFKSADGYNTSQTCIFGRITLKRQKKTSMVQLHGLLNYHSADKFLFIRCAWHWECLNYLQSACH